jgi:nucleoside-diphosphate-sugar epimerase
MESSTPLTVFMTGVTGFVGGTILSCLYKKQPNIHVHALVRKESDAKQLQSTYPNFTPIIGTLSALSVLKSSAAEADFVIHVGGDNVPAVCAMIDGLASSSASPSAADEASPPKPHLISVTGPRSLIDTTLPVTGSIHPSSRPWSDIHDIHTIISLPKTRMHADSDQAIIAQSAARGVGTMLISPGQLFGQGKGLLKKESHSKFYYAACKARGRAFVVGDGSVTWSWCSTGDLGDAVVSLMEKAAMSWTSGEKRVGVNDEGYYFVRTGDVSLMERARFVSDRLRLGDVESVSVEKVREIHPFGQ